MMLKPSNLSLQERIAESTAVLALHNFHWHHATFVLFNSTLLCSVNFFLRLYKKNTIVGQGLFFPSFVSRTRQYVLFGTNISDIEHMLTWMQKHQFDNTGKYVVVCESESRDKCNESDAVNIFWNLKIINVIFINYEEKGDKLNGYTYSHPEDCKNPHPTYLKNWDSCLKKVHLTCRNMYPVKLKNLHGCPILVSTFNQIPYMNINGTTPTGADGHLLCIIAKALNFTLQIVTPRIGTGWGRLEENGTWTGSLADVDNEWANFTMTSAIITISRFATFQMSIDYGFVTIAWVTHPSKLQPSSLKLLRPFQSNVRIALFILFIMIIVLAMFLNSKYFKPLKRELNITIPDGLIFHSWELFMGLPVNSFPTNKALLCLTFFWIWYCFLIRTLYQVCLINSLQTDTYSPEFDTIEEAIASKYQFGGGLPLRDYFIESQLIYDKWLNVESNEIYPRMFKLSEGLKFVLAMNPETTYVFLMQNPDKNLHILPQAIVKSPSVLFFKKYSPLANSLNVVLSRLKESGIIQYVYLNNTGKVKINESSDNMPITMGHYTGCYAILLGGWILSIVCFVVENLMPKKYNRF